MHRKTRPPKKPMKEIMASASRQPFVDDLSTIILTYNSTIVVADQAMGVRTRSQAVLSLPKLPVTLLSGFLGAGDMNICLHAT